GKRHESLSFTTGKDHSEDTWTTHTENVIAQSEHTASIAL
ncbi:MAG: hypothetical protein RIR29_700, partial [Actinomycetota bacterium]